MLKSLRAGAGYLQIDHRDSPGLSPSDVAGIPGAMVAPGGAVTERDLKQCNHCQRGIVLHPLRIRDRGYCPKCDHYVCDRCEAIRVKTGDCVPMVKILEHVGNALTKSAQPTITLTDKE